MKYKIGDVIGDVCGCVYTIRKVFKFKYRVLCDQTQEIFNIEIKELDERGSRAKR